MMPVAHVHGRGADRHHRHSAPRAISGRKSGLGAAQGRGDDGRRRPVIDTRSHNHRHFCRFQRNLNAPRATFFNLNANPPPSVSLFSIPTRIRRPPSRFFLKTTRTARRASRSNGISTGLRRKAGRSSGKRSAEERATDVVAEEGWSTRSRSADLLTLGRLVGVDQQPCR